MHVVVRALTAKPESELPASLHMPPARARQPQPPIHLAHTHSRPSISPLSLSLHHKQVPRAGATTRRQSVLRHMLRAAALDLPPFVELRCLCAVSCAFLCVIVRGVQPASASRVRERENKIHCCRESVFEFVSVLIRNRAPLVSQSLFQNLITTARTTVTSIPACYTFLSPSG